MDISVSATMQNTDGRSLFTKLHFPQNLEEP